MRGSGSGMTYATGGGDILPSVSKSREGHSVKKDGQMIIIAGEIEFPSFLEPDA
jgi:hypothetical protein